MLTDTKARTAKPRSAPYKLADEDGLYLHVLPGGGKSWRFEYRHDGRRETLTLGKYPDLSLAKAREKLSAARTLLADGKSPAGLKRDRKAARREELRNTFEAVAEDWLAEKAALRSPGWKKVVAGRLKNYALPAIGRKPVADIKAEDVLRIMEARAAAGTPGVGECCRREIAMILRWAIVKRRLSGPNVALGLNEAVTVPKARNHRPLTLEEIPEFRARLAAYTGREETKLAMRLLLLTFVRRNELMRAPWAEFDLDAGLWVIPAQRMKARREHLVPLATQAVEALRRLKELAGPSLWVVPHFGDHYRPANGETLGVALRKMGYTDFTPHGLRATASTLLHEIGYRPDIVEMQLAHKRRDAVALAYNKAQYLTERRRMMQDWADLVLSVQKGARIVSLQEARERRAASRTAAA
jgi:integrase